MVFAMTLQEQRARPAPVPAGTARQTLPCSEALGRGCQPEESLLNQTDQGSDLGGLLSHGTLSANQIGRICFHLLTPRKLVQPFSPRQELAP